MYKFIILTALIALSSASPRVRRNVYGTYPQAIPLAAPVPISIPVIHPAPPAEVKSYSIETGHQIAHDTTLVSPVIQSTVHGPVVHHAPIIGQVPVLAPARPIVAAPLPPLALPAY